jgi:uncharacterized membrane protein
MDYSVIQTNKELRAQARKQLQGAWGKMVLAIFIFFVIVTIPQFLFSEYSFIYIPVLEIIISIAVVLISGPFALGLAGFFIKRIRGEEIAIGNIFDGFNRFLQSFLAMLFSLIFVFLWSLLLIVPGIIKGLGYSIVFYILYDDPNIKPLDALKKSQVMMKGFKLKYFLLQLSFIGWALLGVLTLGIGLLWLYPYIYLASANFYENLKANQGTAA